jgi:acetyl/propionyl-CoA carboxylase alpha subunit
VKTLILPKAETKQHHFIGPKSKAIHIMGKLAAKEAVKAYNIPWFPLRRSHYRY